jgi:hypothetical protein
MSYAAFEPARHAMGDTRRFAERTNLIEMQPRQDLSSTGYALANPGEEYLVLQPSATTDPFTVRLAAGTYTVEWFGVESRQTMEAGEVTVERDESLGFTAPLAETEPAVLYLRRPRVDQGEQPLHQCAGVVRGPPGPAPGGRERRPQGRPGRQRDRDPPPAESGTSPQVGSGCGWWDDGEAARWFGDDPGRNRWQRA